MTHKIFTQADTKAQNYGEIIEFPFGKKSLLGPFINDATKIPPEQVLSVLVYVDDICIMSFFDHMMSSVVYFDKHFVTAHFKRWSKYIF